MPKESKLVLPPEPAKKDYTIVPFGYFTCVKLTGESKTIGGIILPEGKSKELKWGHVIARGDPDYTASGAALPLPIKVGDLVCLRPGAGYECRVHKTGDVYTFVNWREILFALRDGLGVPLGLGKTE